MRPARHPYRLTPARRLADAASDRHVADLVRLVLLTGAGERLHRPDFGAGLGASVLFEPLDGALRSVVEVRARGSRARAHRAPGQGLGGTHDPPRESTLNASVTYRLRPAGEQTTVQVSVDA